MIENLFSSFFEINWIIFFLIFLWYTIVDGLYTKYTYDVIELKPVAAANSSAAIYFLLAFGILNFTQNIWYLVPLLLWSWIGTFCFVKYKQNKSKKQ